MIQARPYQSEAIDGIHAAFAENNSTLLVLATGLGKTICFCDVAGDYMQRGKVMILAHRAELVYQARDKMLMVTGSEPDIEMGELSCEYSFIHDARTIVSTIQTQCAGMKGKGRMTKFDPHKFSLLIIDEAHHGAAKSYRRVIDYYRQNPNLKVLGVTATPDRADEKALGQIFETVAFEYGILEGIQGGWLVPIQQQAVYVDGLDYSSCRTTAGDLNGADLAKVLEFEEALHGIASPTIDLIRERRTLVFAASLAQAERLTEIFNRHNSGCARFVHGGTEAGERIQMFKDYAAHEFQMLVNVGITTEGFDDPGIEVVVMARPTKSRSLYAQMIGRGTRTLPGVLDGLDNADGRLAAIAASGKPSLEVIDFVGNSGRHKLISAADVLGGKYEDEVVELAAELAQKESAESGKPVDVISELEKAEQELLRRRREEEEAAVRSVVMIRAKYSTAKVNPFNVLDIMPHRERAWHKKRQPSEKQVAMLERNGVDVSGLGFTHASQIIGMIIKRREEKKCSFKQAKVLRRFGYKDDYLFTEASAMITALKENGWKRPESEVA